MKISYLNLLFHTGLELENNKIQYVSHKYDDHYVFNGSEVIFDDNYPVFITEKDCVKLSGINNKNIWEDAMNKSKVVLKCVIIG